MSDARLERSWEKAEKRLDYYLRDPPRGTHALAALLVAAYGVSVMADAQRGQPLWKLLAWSRTPEVLTALGGRTGNLDHSGEWDRLVQYGLLHWNLVHLGMNLLAIVTVGEVLEALFGPARLWLLFFVASIAGGFASFLAGGDLTVGASGGAFGFLGAMLSFGWRWGARIHPKTRRWFGPLLWPWVLGNLALGFVIPFIDNAAHIGGLLGGLAIGATFGNRVTDNAESSDAVRWLTRALAVGFTLVALRRFV